MQQVDLREAETRLAELLKQPQGVKKSSSAAMAALSELCRSALQEQLLSLAVRRA
jgi:hypothetical protein